MTISASLFTSILAMDSYNRGPGSGWASLAVTPGSAIGNATIRGEAQENTLSFYALSYNWNGKIVVSYRGTDNLSLTGDILSGWSIGAGVTSGNQAGLAAQFYTGTTGAESIFSPAAGNVILTGHSLGGGLAGYVASLSHATAYLYDHMPFGVAAVAQFAGEALLKISQSETASAALGVTVGDASARFALLLVAVPAASQVDIQSALSIVGLQKPQWQGNVTAYNVDGEILELLRNGTASQVLTSVAPFLPVIGPLALAAGLGSSVTTVALESSVAHVEFPSFDSGLSATELHSPALAVLLQYADENGHSDWYADADGAKALLQALFNQDVAEAAGLSGGEPSAAEKMMRMIAYSAIDEGTRVFGDTGIKALFDDAEDLGNALGQGSQTLKELADPLALIAAQYAGQLARIKALESANPDTVDGVFALSPDEQTLVVDFSTDQWGPAGGSANVYGRDAFVAAVLEKGDGEIDAAKAKMNWLWSTSSTEIIDRFALSTVNGAVNTTLPERPGGQADTVTLMVSGDGGDVINGSNQRDFIAGGKGDDRLDGRSGDDLLIGGDGNDTLNGGDGKDALVGGEGDDFVDMGGQGSIDLQLNGPSSGSSDFIEIKPSGAPDADRLYEIETVRLSNADDRVQVTSLAQVGDALTVDGAGGRDELDLTAISDNLIFNSGAVRENSAGDFFATALGSGDKLTFQHFEELRFGGGDDYVVSGAGVAEIYLGGGNDVLQRAGAGTRVFGEGGNDIFGYSPGAQIADATPDDRVYFGSIRLTGGLHWKGSTNPYAWNLSHTIGYGLNHEGDLVVHVRQLFAPIEDMFIADWQGGPGYTQNDAGIYVAEVEIGVFRLLDPDKPPHLTQLGTWELFMGAMMKANYGVSLWASVDPIALDLDGDGLELTGLSFGNLVFDIDGDGYGERTGWVRGDDGILVLDANSDGQIKDVSEMFGGPGQSGFAELATHDGNADGKVDASDTVFANLRVWRDLDQDRVVDAGELFTLAQLGITSLGVTGTPSTATNATNQINATGTFTLATGGTGVTSDVAFNVDNQSTLFMGDRSVSTAAAALPDLKGYGTLPDLHVAMTLTPSLQGVVSSNLAGLGGLDLVALRDALTPILTAWANASPVNGRPPLLAHDDVPILVNVVGGLEEVSDFAYSVTDPVTSQTYWKLASGTVVKDANGAAIDRPTLQQIQADTHLDGTWSSLDGDVIGFFERYMGERLPLDQAPTNPTAAVAGMTEVIGGFWGLLNSMAVRVAMQGPLASFFPGLKYDVATDGFEATTARQLIPTFEAVFTQVDALGSAGLARLNAWNPILNIVIGDYRQPDGLLNTNGFLFSNIVAAYESVGLDLGIVAVAGTLGLPADLIRTGTSAVAGGTDADLFYLTTGNQTLSGGLGPDTYVVGRNFGQDVINDLEGQGDSHSEDVVRFADVASTGVVARREGLDLVITVSGTSDELRIVNQFDGRQPGLGGAGDLSEETGVDYIVFSDGVTWDDFDIAKAVSRPEAGDQTLTGTATIDVLDGGAGNDSLSGNDDADFYVFGRDYGNDVVNDDGNHLYLEDGDTVAFRPGIAFEDIIWSRFGSSDDLLIKVRGDGGSLKIVGQFAKTYTGPFGEQFLNMVENFQFADGRVVTWDDVIEIIKATSGTDGNDTIYGYDLEDDLAGGKGDDYLSGGNENDTYRYKLGDGHDVIEEDADNLTSGLTDKVVLGAGIVPTAVTVTRPVGTNDIKLTFADGGSVLLKGQLSALATGPFGVVWFDRLESIVFEDAPGTIWTPETLMAKALENAPTAGNDTIEGFWRQDRIDGGAGNDSLAGGSESDTYVFGRGSGQDTVYDSGNAFETTNTDVIEFKPDVLVSDIALDRSGTDMILRISGTTDQVTLKSQNFITTVGGYQYQIEQVKFADGTVWTPVFMREEYIRQAKTSGPDSITGFSSKDTLDGGAGNDTLAGGDNIDIYKFDLGGGQDVIREGVGNVAFDYTHDEVVFGAGLTTTMVRASIAGRDLELTFVGTTDKLTIKDTFYNSYAKVETFRFADGTVLTERQLIDLALAGAGTSGPDSLTGTNVGDQINGLAGADTITGVAGDDVLIGGLDNDRLEGGLGNDVYRYDLGDGNDDIYDSGYSDHVDTLELGVGITPAMVRLSWAADDTNDLLLSFDGQVGLIRLNQQNYTSTSGIDRLMFVDGTVWTQADMMAAYASQAMTAGADTIRGMYISDSLSGGDGNDQILADSGDDTLVGGAGNDRLEGSYGSDTYLYGLGDGNDDLYDSGYPEHVDTLVLGAGITTSMIRLAWAGDDVDDLIMTFDGQVGSIRLNEHARRGGDGIDLVKFADGTTWTGEQLFAKYLEQTLTAGADLVRGTDVAESIAGGAGDDTIDARSGADTLAGGQGNDRLEGSYSADLYRYDPGDGIDTIYDDGYASDNDVLELGAGLTKAGLRVAVASDDADDLILTFDGQAGSIRLDEQGRGYGVELVRFTDGSTMTRLELAAAGSSSGTSGADTLPGSAGPDTIAAGDGNDSVGGLDGADLVNGEGGADTIEAGAGDDTLMGGAGDDLLKGGAGADRFDGGDGVDTLDLSYTTGWVADLGAGTVTFGASTASDTVVNVENVTGGGGADVITGDGAANRLRGASGNDSLAGGAGADTLEGGAGTNSLSGGDGADVLYGNDIGGASSSNTLEGGAGDDALQSGTQADTYIFGVGHGADTISESATTSAGRDDIVRYLSGTAPADINVSRTGSDLWLIHDNGVDKIKVVNFFGNANLQWAIERVEFAESTVWTREQLINMAAPQGTTGTDTLVGSEVGEALSGGDGGDSLSGASGNDILNGDGGADTLNGDAGDDTQIGGAGDDLLFGNVGVDRFEGGDGVDTLDMTYYSGVDVDLGLQQAFRTGATEVVTGIENITGGSGADIFIGDAAANRFIGGGGADTLDGAAGADTMTGGTGNDQFRFGNVAHFATGSEYDLISDFTSGDKISLSGIDADGAASGDQAFVFVATAAFSNVAGQLRYVVGSGVRTVYGDTNGDGLADFQFQLTGTTALVASDFIL